MSEKKLENLCFEGGGVRGFAYFGALQELPDLENYKRFAGTSVGSIFAAFLAVGMTKEQILGVKDRISLKLPSDCFLTNIYNILSSYSIYSMDFIETQLRDILSIKVDPYITLKKLFDKTQKELVIVSCCLSRKQPVYFHHATFPNVKLLDAIMTSIAVPLVFTPPQHDYLGSLDYYIDGGIVDNYPIWIFNNIDMLYEGKLDSIDKDNIDEKTLGLKLLCPQEVTPNTRDSLGNIFNYSKQLVDTLITQIERVNISPSYIKQTTRIVTENVNFTDFDISEEQIDDMIYRGSEAIKKRFSS